MQCLYCSAPGNSLEHALPAAFGEFRDAPNLENRVCTSCNNTRLGVLDEQVVRCGPEGLLRRYYAVRGRDSHDAVNAFERGSAGGHRLDVKSMDEAIGLEVALEIENGHAQQMRQIIFVEESGRVHHLPIRKGTTPGQLRARYTEIGVTRPLADVSFFCSPEEKIWVEKLIQETWPGTTVGPSALGSTTYRGFVGTVVLTNRYFRAIAKIGFHYFLTQFPEYTGHERIFSGVRQYIIDETSAVEHANVFVGKR